MKCILARARGIELQLDLLSSGYSIQDRHQLDNQREDVVAPEFALIDRQFSLNRGKNVFFNGNGAKLELDESFHTFLEGIHTIPGDLLEALLDYAVNQAVIELSKLNQYYNFSSADKIALRGIYSDFVIAVKKREQSIREIHANHAVVFRSWLYKANPFSLVQYRSEGEVLEPVSCFEYDAELQTAIFKMDLATLTNPVLDIGCGEHAGLVEYLRSKGFDCFGLDRFDSALPNIANENWLEYDYGKGKWGTIVSNLGFSNHFVHHHIREDGNFIDYAKTYMRILNSLTKGGTFFYAPHLPFIEELLDQTTYHTETHVIHNVHSAAKVTRIR